MSKINKKIALLAWFESKFPTHEQVFVPTFLNDGKGWKFTDYFEEMLKDVMTAVETETRKEVKAFMIARAQSYGNEADKLMKIINEGVEESIPDHE